jgi:hypothetical protein
MNRQTLLTVHPPFPKKQLGRYQNIRGAYLVHYQGNIVYVGDSKNLTKAIYRLFQSGGALEDLCFEKCTFEVVLSKLQKGSVAQALKIQFKPEYNYEPKLRKCKAYRKKQSKRILEAYQVQTRLEVKGEHKTDSKHEQGGN